MNRTLWFIWIFTLAYALIWPVSVYNDLPQQIASSFNESGAAKAFTDKDTFYTIWIVVILFINSIMLLMGSFAWKYFPYSVNVPNRSFWLSTEARKAEAALKLKTGMTLIAILCNILSVTIFTGILNYDQKGEMPFDLRWLLISFAIAMFACILYFIWSFRVPQQSSQPPGMR